MTIKTRRDGRTGRPPKIPPPPPVPKPLPAKREPLSILENWYLQCLRQLTAHLKRPPSLIELSQHVRRSVNSCYVALLRCERKGHAKRNHARKFVILDGAGSK